jgi:UDP-N-acetylmuramoylalanine--D-glutamate ligase
VNVEGKTVLVLGLGDTGLSMARWLTRRGGHVRVADTRAAPPRLEELRRSLPRVEVRCGPDPGESFAGIDLIAVSPGVPLDEPPLRDAIHSGVPVAGDIELFARSLDSARRPRVLAITGTNGKSTVTALAGAMARAAGADCEVAGNIGPPVLDASMRREDEGRAAALWVLELSSFQLETTSSLAASAATVLNVTEDHLDRYRGMDEYAGAKARVFQGDGVQVLNRDDPRSLGMALPGRTTVSFGLDAPRRPGDYGVVAHGREQWLAEGTQALLPVKEMKLAGRHNAANALAALALCRAVDLPMQPLVSALRSFTGLPHRVEPAGDIGGVRYYDDSKGTNVGASVAAIAGLAHEHAKIVLIAGGEGKGQDFAPLREPLARAARAVVLIGRDAPLIEKALSGLRLRIRQAATMDEAVAEASAEARSGDAVLLSPACASFDMFRNYAHRGEAFRAAVERLAHERPH